MTDWGGPRERLSVAAAARKGMEGDFSRGIGACTHEDVGVCCERGCGHTRGSCM